MMRGFLIACAAVASVQGQATGQTSNGTNLLTVCGDLESQSLDSGHCVGVASGYMAGLERGVYPIITELLALGVLEEPTTEEQAREL